MIPPTPIDLEQLGSMSAGGSILAGLRAVMPNYRPIATATQQRYTEMQANALLRSWRCEQPPVPVERISAIPQVEVEYAATLPVHGAATWIGQHWVISLSNHDCRESQRFTLAHELKHIVDFRDFEELHNHRTGVLPDDHAESLADYFAMCLLMPSVWVQYAWQTGCPDADTLASMFDVTPILATRRLWQLGLTFCGPICTFSPIHIYRRTPQRKGDPL